LRQRDVGGALSQGRKVYQKRNTHEPAYTQVLVNKNDTINNNNNRELTDLPCDAVRLGGLVAHVPQLRVHQVHAALPHVESGGARAAGVVLVHDFARASDVRPGLFPVTVGRQHMGSERGFVPALDLRQGGGGGGGGRG